MPAAIPIAASMAGAAVSSSMNKGSSGGGGGTVSKDPWGPAAPHLERTLNEGGLLQAYQQQNPFNQLQQTGYQNMFTDLDAFRGQNNGLMQFANQLMGANYQRGQQSTPAGLLAAQSRQGMGQNPQAGLLAIPQGDSYGRLNWQELNPWTATGGPRVAQKPAGESEEERRRREEAERNRAAATAFYSPGDSGGD
jgi:hypothetical protein